MAINFSPPKPVKPAGPHEEVKNDMVYHYHGTEPKLISSIVSVPYICFWLPCCECYLHILKDEIKTTKSPISPFTEDHHKDKLKDFKPSKITST